MIIVALHLRHLIRIGSDIYHSLEYTLGCNSSYLHKHMIP